MRDQRLIEGIVNQWGVANSLTLLRCVLILPAMWCAFCGWFTSVEVIIVMAILTDAEGQYARWTNTMTPLGRVFDPLADKAFTDMLLFAYAFMTQDVRVLILATCTILYDVDNTVRRVGEIVDACNNRAEIITDVPVTLISKSKTVLLFATVFIMYLPPQAASKVSELLVNIVITSALAAVLGSWFHNRKDLLRQLIK